ncbi:MAG: PhnD/SsuA/transferrin family substrate-binding protein, partial [Desulfobulbaceae bacterium]
MTSSRQSKTLFIARQTASFLCWGSAVFLYIFSSCIQPAFCAETTETASIKIGVLAKSGKEATRKEWNATAEYLTATIPHSSFEIVPVDFDQVRQTTADKKIDFLITNSGNYVELEFEYGISRIATLKNIVNNIPSTLFGGVIFTTSNRDDISTLHDLVGKSFHAVAPESFGGWLAALREMRAAGITPTKDCKELRFGGTHDAVVRAVIEGIADAGTVRTDTLERMAEEGKIDLSSLKILNAQPSQENFSYLLSTRLYPEWPFAKLKHTSDSLAEKVAIALLSMPADSQAAKDSRIGGWTVPLDYQPVHELYQELDLGPYARHLGPIRLADLIHQHWKSLLVIVSLFCLLFAITLFTMLLNRRLVAAQGEITLYRLHLEKLVENRTAELSSSERKLARAQRIANLGSWEWDIRKNTLLWAKEVYPIFGLSSDNLPDNLPLSYDLFIDLVHPADRKMVVRAFNDAVTRRTKVNLDHRLLLSDGSEKFVNEQAEIYFGEDGIPLKMVGTIQDITARKLLEQEHSR